MTTGTEVVNYSMTLLGYTDREGSVDSANYADVYKGMLVYLNAILADICDIEGIAFTPLTALDTTLTISQKSIDNILPYGVAWFAAKNTGDGVNEGTFASLYQQKRGGAPHTKKYITNVYASTTEE